MDQSGPGSGGPDGAIGRRAFVAGGMACGLVGRSAEAAGHDILVSAQGRYPTLAAAIDEARRRGGATRIGIAPGVVREKLRIDVPDLTIEGVGAGATIAFDAGAALPGPDGRNWGTSGSATLTIAAPGVTLRNLTIRNDHDYPAAPMQAVALAVQAGGDRCVVDRCRVESWQDTLLLQAPTLVTNSRIAGNIDFVFGGAAAWIGDCEIVSRQAAGRAGGFVAAPSTPAVQPYGLVFAGCRLVREAGLANGSVFLGRPWRAGGNMALLGHAAFLRCWMDRHVAREGWTSMGFRDPAGVQRQLQPLDARLFEWRSRGPGGAAGISRRQLTDAAALAMTPVSVLGSWVAEKSGRGMNGRGWRT